VWQPRVRVETLLQRIEPDAEMPREQAGGERILAVVRSPQRRSAQQKARTSMRSGSRGSKTCLRTPGFVFMARTRRSAWLIAAVSPARWFSKMRCFAAA